MGKNQAYKAMQRARVGSTSGAPDDGVEDGMVDGSFHTPEWHAARLASLKTSHTITWEDYKKKQKEDELKKGELEKDTDRMMQEYRAQLDAERAHKLANGRNHSAAAAAAARKSSHRKYKKKEKDPKKRSSRKRKHSRRGSSDSSSSSSSSESSDTEDERDARRSKSRSKRGKKEKRHRSRSKRSCGDDEGGPVPLSKFFGSMKSAS